MKSFSTILKSLFLFISLGLPVFLFEECFRSQFDVLELTGGVYRDAPMIYVSISVLLTVIYLWLTPRWFPKKAYKIAIILGYSLFFAMMCTQVAWDYRINFGTTWRLSEVFFELVAPLWYFYAIGIVGLALFYFIQHLIVKK